MAMKEYKFAVKLCGGCAGGTISVKAKDEESAYEKAMNYVKKKLNSAFPTLKIDFNVEREYPDNCCVTYSVEGRYSVYLKKSKNSLKKLISIAENEVCDVDFGVLRSIEWFLVDKPTYDSYTNQYEFDFRITGYFDAYVNIDADDDEYEEKAKELGEQVIVNADFVSLSDIQWEVCDIEIE